MTQDAFCKFFSDSITHLGQFQPQAASSLSPLLKLVRQEDSRSPLAGVFHPFPETV